MSEIYYKYEWEITFQIPSRKMSFKPYSLVEFRQDCLYFTNLISIYSMVVKIQDRNLMLLRTFDKELTVIIKKIMHSGESRDTFTDKKILWEDVFIPFYDKDNIPNYTKSSKVVSDKYDDMNQQYLTDVPGAIHPVEIKMNLLLKRDLQMRKFMHNYVLGKEDDPASTATAVGFIIDQNPYIEKFIMDPPDNVEKYTDLIVKPKELDKAIKLLQIEYGIYAKGLLLFYENGVLYVLNKFHTEHSYQKDEINTVVVRIDEQVAKLSPIESAVIDVKNKFIGYERTAKIYRKDYESIAGEMVGDKFVYSSFGSVINSVFGSKDKASFVSPLNTIERSIPSHVETGVKKLCDYDMLNNNFNMSSYMYETTPGIEIGFALTAVNCEHFTPNKRIKLNLDSPESKKLYSGIYNIKEACFIDKTTSKVGEEFMTWGHCTLKLCNKTDGFDKDYSPKPAKD